MTFELGLVMAGAISAGAYSASVLDFLLRLWTHTKKRRGSRGGAVRHTMSECL